MADEGATTVGSIVGHLKMDVSEWNRDIDAAKAKAHELGSASPDVRIDTNAAEAATALESVAVEADKIGATRPAVRIDSNAPAAVVALEAVEAEAAKIGESRPTVHVDTAPATASTGSLAVATARLEAAERAAANAASTAYVAQLRLKDLQEKGAASALQLAVAEEALARADRNAEAAEAKHAATSAALTAAQTAAAGAAHEESAATDEDTQSAKSNTAANHQRVSGLQVLIGLAPAILAAVAPVGGAAVGLGSAFGVMAISGVLAINGIKQAMEVGDQVGNTYSSDIIQLKGNLNDLSGTAANGMLAGFNQVVGDINQDMPFLNQTVGTFSGMLGQLGGTTLHGVLTGLQAMNPLLQEGGLQLSHFVGWLMSFTSTNGFNQFVTYAVDNLPSVMTMLENLVTTAGHIIAAFAPLGPTVIGILNGISVVLNALPLPVLAGLVATATLAGPAFTIARTAVAMFGTASATAAGEVTLFGMAANLAVPVVGILMAAVAGIGLAFASSAASGTTATQVTQDYTQALKDDNDALGEHVRLQAAKALSDSGAFGAAQQLGISQKTLTDYTLGNADAQQEVGDKIAYAKRLIDQASISVDNYGRTTQILTPEQQKLKDAIDKVTGSTDAQKAALDRGKQANQDVSLAVDNQTLALQGQAAQYGTTVQAYQAAQTAQENTAGQLATTTLNMQLQNDAAGILKGSLDALNGKAMSAAQAQNAFDSSLANMGDHVDKTGKKITFTTTSISDMSSASVALRGQLNGQISALQQTVEANGGLNDSTGKAKAEMEKMRQQIIDNAVAHGVDKDAVTAYVDNLLTIPKTVPPTKLDIDKAKADQDIADFKALLASINDKRVQVTTDYVSNGKDTGIANTTNAAWNAPGARFQATGGPVAYLASGGSPFPGGPRGTDTVPTWLTPGEFVVNRDATARNRPALEAMNAGRAPTGQEGPTVINHYHTWNITDQRDPVATASETSRRFTKLAV